MWWKKRQADTPARKRDQGASAETLAADFLVAHGARILARNVHCRGGEVDLIARMDGAVVFVEVRLRRHVRFGGAAESITAAKQRRVALAAQHWLSGAGQAYSAAPCRFDAILLDRLDTAAIQWIPAAFDAGVMG
ncbi:YraN family protein [Uliginosibacterium sp. sgz301328]|uniref:YraN family protein n=1 Tax=Uliginosibacterium sp. sgz301328 TaxID=3243764 RepID=UPI00359E59B2